MKRFFAPMISVAVAFAPFAASAKCFPQDLTSALGALALKRELMVASLSCSGDMSGDYNRFVTQHAAALDSESRRLQAHFRKEYGGQSEARFMKFDSAVANEISYKVVMNSNYCTEAVQLFSTVREMERTRLIEVATSRPPLDNVVDQMCPASKTAPRAGQGTAEAKAPAPIQAAVQAPAGAARPR